MLDVQLQGYLQVRLPDLHCLFRKTIHQVDTDIVEAMLLCPPHRDGRLISRVPSAEERQLLVVEALNADTDAVEWEQGEHTEVLLREVVGIGLYGDLRIGHNGIVGEKGIEDLLKVVPLQS